jgi:hypothetical protein
LGTYSAPVEDNAVVIDESALPQGWTLARVRELEPSAELLDPDAHFVVSDERPVGIEYEVLLPTVILSFTGLCPCGVPDIEGTAQW